MDEIQAVLIKQGHKDLAQEYFRRVAYLVQRGETYENDFLRIHRYARAIFVWDLTNAGKRGKQVQRVSFETDGYRDAKPVSYDLIESLTEMKSYNDVINALKKEGIEFHEYQEKGIAVAPAGFKPIQVSGKGVHIDADYDSFMVRNNEDQNNLPTCIPAIRGGKADIKVFYRWVKDNADRLKTMDYNEVLLEMDKNKIQYHSYCAMD